MEDQETFARVWSRVAPGPDCPVEVGPPPRPALVCFGSPPGEGERLMALTRHCTQAARRYAALAGQGRGRNTLTQLSRRSLRNARRAGAAYFLLTGVRLRSQPEPRRPQESLFPALRRLYQAERAWQEQLSAWQGSAQDPELRALYGDLALEAQLSAQSIRSLLEQAP